MNTDIEKILQKIIPPPTFQEREGFNNHPLLDQLSSEDKILVEQSLIERLKLCPDDTLIVETLAYLKSTLALPTIYSVLNSQKNPLVKIMVAASIFQINNDESMIATATESLRHLESNEDKYLSYQLSFALAYLAQFKHEETIRLIEEYLDSEDVILSYNARDLLGLKL